MSPDDRREVALHGIRVVLVAILVMVPIAAHLFQLPGYGRLQRDDYYGVLAEIADADGWSGDPARWIGARINLHLVAVPALLWAANVELTGGDNRATALLAMGFLGALALLLRRRLPGALGESERALLIVALALFVFNPVNSYNLALSFGGTHYFLADLLAVLAMGILVDCRTGGGSRFGAWPLLPLGLVAALTFSSHLALWPTLLLGALALRLPRRRIAILGAAAMLAVAIYAGLGGQFATATVREPADPVVLLVYLGRFLGGLFGRDATISCVVGWAGVVVAAALGWTLWRRGPEAAARTPLVFWTMVQLYAAANGLLAGLGRADRGELQPTVSRYALYPALFWLATAVLFTLLRSDAWTARRRRRALAILGLFLLASASSMTARAESEIAVFLNRGHRQVVTERALQWDAWDLELLGATMSQRPEKVVELLDVLRGLGHVPFDRPAPPWPERKVVRTERSGASSAELEGLFGSVQSTRDPAIVRVRGWVRSPGPVVEEVVFVDVRGDRRSWIAAGLPPPRLEADPDDGHEGGSGWEGFVRRDGPQIVWRPLVRLRGEEFFHPLRRASHLDRRLREMGPPGTSDAVYTAPPKPSDP